MAGKQIKIGIKKNIKEQPSNNITDVQDNEDLLSFVVKFGELMNSCVYDLTLNIGVESIPAPESFFLKLDERMEAAGIGDVKRDLSMKFSA